MECCEECEDKLKGIVGECPKQDFCKFKEELEKAIDDKVDETELNEYNYEDNDIEFKTESGTSYRMVKNEDYAEELARGYLEEDSCLWKEAVACGRTTSGFDDWIDEVLSMDGWAEVLSHYDGDYQTLKDGRVLWRT